MPVMIRLANLDPLTSTLPSNRSDAPVRLRRYVEGRFAQSRKADCAQP